MKKRGSVAFVLSQLKKFLIVSLEIVKLVNQGKYIHI
jgi:hypothetical protein